MNDRPLFLIVVLDGMRRDRITPELTPNLARFRNRACDFVNSRSVFPSETRVNAAALGTGCTPGRHGIVANRFFDPAIIPERLFETAPYADISRGLALGAGFVTAPTLGEALATAGLSLAVVGSGSAGTTRMVDPRAADLGHVGLCLREWAGSTPKDAADEALSLFGPLPPAAMPNTARTRLQTRIFTDYVFPRFSPDVSVLWYTDPDSTFHYKGIGSPEAKRALCDLDGEFGRLLAWRRDQGLEDRMQIFLLSDHGQIVTRRKVSVARSLGPEFRIGPSFRDGADAVLSAGYSGAVWVRDHDPARTRALVAALNARPWIGSVWAGRDGDAFPGAFPLDSLRAIHPRAPDIFYVMAADDGSDALGIAGGCACDDPVPEGGGVHGGLHLNEINDVMMAEGSRFKAAHVSSPPAGIIDVAPTVLDLLGLAGGAAMDGRPLREAYAAGGAQPPPLVERVLDFRQGRRRHALTLWTVGTTPYLARHRVE